MTIDRFSGAFSFLSNFHPCSIELNGMIFPSVEHAFQAAKTLDFKQRQAFQTGTAGQAKRRGREVKLREDWEEVKVSVMRWLLKHKFQDPELRAQLLATGDEELIEGNTWNDTFWGVCRGKGRNQLGLLLMEIREGLRT